MMLLFGEPLFAMAANVNEISDFFGSTATSVTDETIPKALTVMWGYALNGSLYKMICSLGLFAAVIGAGFWALKFYRALQEGAAGSQRGGVACSDCIFAGQWWR